ncbi:MAG: c-type cytochrome [Planctomycetes bacterium]|nr:c-type cytochrome [Planctomycetota bacterium]
MRRPPLRALPILAALACARGAPPTAAQDGHHDHGSPDGGSPDRGSPGVAPGARPAPPRVFLDKPARVVHYQLRRLSNAQLLLVERRADDPRYRPVFEAILAREGLERKHREEALAALVRLSGSDAVAEVLAAIGRLEGLDASHGSALHDLAALLAAQGPRALAARRAELQALATGTGTPAARRIGFAGLVLADGAVDRAWELAAGREALLRELLESLPMVPDEKVRASFYPRARELIDRAAGAAGAAGDTADAADAADAVRRAAVEALAEVPGREAEAFALLAALVRAGKDVAPAVRALRRIPAAKRPREGLPELARSVVERARGIPEAERTSPEALEALELGQELAAALPREEAAEVRKALASLGVRIVLLKTVPHQMLFDRRFFAVEAGKPVEVVLENPDIMPHNLVVTAPGALEEVGRAAELLLQPSDPRAPAYVPDSPKVLHATRLVPPGGREKLSFKAPAEPGEHPFVCTYPGHWRRMYGVMVVVADLEAWLEAPVEPADPLGNTRRLVKEWSAADFAVELAAAAAPGVRSHERGKALFAEAGCVQCHRVRGEGGAVGPELTEVFGKLKTREALLAEVLEPGKTVEEKYRVHALQTTDGRVLTGLVVAEDGATVSIVTNPQDPRPQDVPKDEIALRAPAEGSLMPVGLLNTFAKDEVLEVVAYLEAGGDPASAVYGR